MSFKLNITDNTHITNYVVEVLLAATITMFLYSRKVSTEWPIPDLCAPFSPLLPHKWLSMIRDYCWKCVAGAQAQLIRKLHERGYLDIWNDDLCYNLS